MKIAMYSDFFLPQVTGIADSIGILANQLTKNGHQVRIYTLNIPNTNDKQYSYEVVRYPSWEVPNTREIYLVWPFTRKEHDAFKPDIIHFHTIGPVGLKGLISAKMNHIPLIATEHTVHDQYMHYFKLDYSFIRYLVNKIAEICHQQCDFVFSPSTIMIKTLQKYGFSKPAEPLSNSIIVDVYKPLPNKSELKKEFGISKPAILSFGGIAPEKEISVMIKAFAKAVNNGLDAELVLIGKGPDRTNLENLAKELKVSERTKFLGFLEEAKAVRAVNACDVYCITSTCETQSMTMLQAMACGLPAIGVNAGGLPEYIKDGETGYVVKPYDIDAVAEKMTELIKNTELRKKMSKNSREFAEQFAPEKIVQQVQKVYEKVIAEKKK